MLEGSEKNIGIKKHIHLVSGGSLARELHSEALQSPFLEDTSHPSSILNGIGMNLGLRCIWDCVVSTFWNLSLWISFRACFP